MSVVSALHEVVSVGRVAELARRASIEINAHETGELTRVPLRTGARDDKIIETHWLPVPFLPPHFP